MTGRQPSLYRPRRDYVAETKVDLKRNTGRAQKSAQIGPLAAVQLIITDGKHLQGLKLEDQPVIRTWYAADCCNQLSNSLCIALPKGQKVYVTCSSVWLLHPQSQQGCPLQDAPLPLDGFSQTVKEPLASVTDEKQFELTSNVYCLVEEARPD